MTDREAIEWLLHRVFVLEEKVARLEIKDVSGTEPPKGQSARLASRWREMKNSRNDAA